MLAEVLASPLEDPMSREWVAVPTAGMRRWLALELARSLGASAPGAGDGVAANIEFTFPGALRQVVLASQSALADPWQVDCLVWAVLEVLRSGAGDERLGRLTLLPPGATWFGRARRLADLFDRYAVRRPELRARLERRSRRRPHRPPPGRARQLAAPPVAPRPRRGSSPQPARAHARPAGQAAHRRGSPLRCRPGSPSSV